MGIFGNLKKNFKDGTLMANLQSAGAISGGDYGTAAQIQGMHRKTLQSQQEEAAKQAQMQAAVQALIARGVPPQEAAIIAQGGGADGYLAQQNAPRTPSEFERALTEGGTVRGSPEWVAAHAQRARTMALPSPQPIIDPQTGSVRWVTPPPPTMPGASAGPPPQAIEALRANPQLQGDFDRKYGPGSAARVLGGAGGNTGGTFRFGGQRTRF